MASAYNKYGGKINWVYEGDLTSLTNVTKGKDSPGVTVRDKSGKVSVYINSYAFSDPGLTYLVIGHEFVHANLLLNGQFDKWSLKYDPVIAGAISEFYAYSWQSGASSLLGISDYGGTNQAIRYVPFVPMSELINYSRR